MNIPHKYNVENMLYKFFVLDRFGVVTIAKGSVFGHFGLG